jgi:OPA family sugar phosphate sensor protein UhpC-like MFS transporter
LLGFFAPAPDAAPISQTHARRWGIRVFASITLGYTVFYLTRLPTSVAKDPMIGAGVLSINGAGVLDSVFLITYAVGKTINGFLADRASVRRLFATALLVSALANLVFGSASSLLVFLPIWVINGWVQSVGVPVSGVVMATWFPSRQLGTRYSIWSMAHHLGEGLTLLVTAQLIELASGFGEDAWRAAFIIPALVAFASALVLYKTLADRPAAVGLPPVVTEREPGPLGSLQLAVLRDPAILVCGLASALVYVSRYAINNWGVFYLQKSHGYSVGDAGAALSIFPLAGIPGALVAGPISDRLTNGRRVPIAFAYGALFCVAMTAFYLADDAGALRVALACGGFAMGGLLVFLGGLVAMELCSKRAAGAALGVIGGFSYLGAALQSLLSSQLIEAGRTGDTYDFTAARWLWLGAPFAMLALTALLWPAERARKA